MTAVNHSWMPVVHWLVKRIGQVTGGKSQLGKRTLQELASAPSEDAARVPWPHVLPRLFRDLDLDSPAPTVQLSAVELPVLVVFPDGEVGIVLEHTDEQGWVCDSPNGRRLLAEWPAGTVFLPIRPKQETSTGQGARQLFDAVFGRQRSWMFQAALASTAASILVLGTSLYTMQVYDRVIGQGGLATLVVLTIGVLIAIAVEFALKMARSRILDQAMQTIDVACAQGVFAQLLRVRMDQFPASVGSLSAQVRGFESVRAYRAALRIYLLTDAPYALFFLFVIYLLGGPMVALIPTIALVLAVVVGWSFKRAIHQHSVREDLAGQRRQGLLVEVIQAAEVIKSTGSAWLSQSRWNQLSRQTTQESSHIKLLNETSSYASALIQQGSYVGLVATGAYLATTSQTLTIGAIIACSILSGRVLTPILQIPGLMVQWAHARVAMDNLEKLFALQTDHGEHQQPLRPEALNGDYRLQNIEFAFQGQTVGLNLANLNIRAGERVAIVGHIGAGKSTLLKLLAGLIKPRQGQVLIDGMDIQQIELSLRAETIGYLPQSTRLIGGTLRENLCMGAQHYSDAQIQRACQLTGLAQVVAARPEGLDLRIAEGGEGLSGGQKQLVALTRVLLASPKIWLLDEPTAFFDDATEQKSIQALKASLQPQHTLVLVTHKFRLLELVDRIIVLSPSGGVQMDGPKDEVFARMQAIAQTVQASRSATTVQTVQSPTGRVARPTPVSTA